MTSLLNMVSSGVQKQGLRIVITGLEKVGKTTLATNAPRPLLIPLENGAVGVSCNKTPMITEFDDIMALLNEICEACQNNTFVYQTLVFDSVTALEQLIHKVTIARDPKSKNAKELITMESACGGFGKAYPYANNLFGQFLQACDYLAIQYGINIIFTCHAFAAKLIDPQHGEYDSWDILLHSPKNQKTYGKREMVTQWADMIGFLHEPIFVSKGEDINKAVSANKGRILAVERTPSYVAGNRFKMVNEIQIPLENGWNHLAQEIYNSCGIDIYNRDV